ncbi:hypothetical protein [Brenneria rubrifaciens]|uniref:DUF2282 domain-containing protein n=1 Tax=Brenneria rubrifaciens TaxID=55213 RepID=A0A4P8QYX8_9GAMM|nr:hypothetical protein [Brenneria rubrifaciens]QCR09515.1 hypothetical protein EH207_13895 [Brenneria rubrifaciens]
MNKKTVQFAKTVLLAGITVISFSGSAFAGANLGKMPYCNFVSSNGYCEGGPGPMAKIAK